MNSEFDEKIKALQERQYAVSARLVSFEDGCRASGICIRASVKDALCVLSWAEFYFTETQYKWRLCHQHIDEKGVLSEPLPVIERKLVDRVHAGTLLQKLIDEMFTILGETLE